jgi:hypothetical protein
LSGIGSSDRCSIRVSGRSAVGYAFGFWRLGVYLVAESRKMTPINSVSISGRIIEILDDGGATARVRIGHYHAWIAADGQAMTGTTMLMCRAWGHSANALRKYGSPGRDLVIVGRLISSGDALELLADSISFVSPRQAMQEK